VTSVRETCSLALRKLGKLGAGREPRSADLTDTAAALQGLYTSWIATGAFGRLADVIPTQDYTAGENQRIFRNSDSVLEIDLPETIPTNIDPLPYNLERDTYGANYEGVNGNARPPRDGAVVVISDGFTGLTRSFIYDGAVRLWQSIDALGLDDHAPRSDADPHGLAACLALEVADQFGAEPLPGTAKQAARYLGTLTQRFSMPREASVGVYC
jgi:hypothetical protein